MSKYQESIDKLKDKDLLKKDLNKAIKVLQELVNKENGKKPNISKNQNEKYNEYRCGNCNLFLGFALSNKGNYCKDCGYKIGE